MVFNRLSWRKNHKWGKKVNNWFEVETDNEIKKFINYENFTGVVLFKTKFRTDTKNDDIILEYQPEKDLKWGLWEYDIYINGKNILSSMINKNQKDYKFEKTKKNTY